MRASEAELTAETKTIAVVGAPNSGKTTLYNWLTGSRFKIVNYPGATVEFSFGENWLRILTNLTFRSWTLPGLTAFIPKVLMSG